MPVYAVIGDIVGSRRQPSRTTAQAMLVAGLGAVNGLVPAVQTLEPTVGDEFQGVYATREHALVATLAVRLWLTPPMDVRFGIGAGVIGNVGVSRYGLVQDGPAWWAAREAIEAAKSMESRHPGVRAQFRHRAVRGPADPAHAYGLDLDASAEPESAINAYLLCRDTMTTALSARQRRIGWQLLTGAAQREIAEAEGISASAVSQAVRNSGLGALLGAANLLFSA